MTDRPVTYCLGRDHPPRPLEVTTELERDGAVLLSVGGIPILRLTTRGTVVKLVHTREDVARLRAMGMTMDGSTIWVY